MIPNKQISDDLNDDFDIGEDDNPERNDVEKYISDSHFKSSEDQGGDKYKQELINKLLQSGRENAQKKKPNINEITERLYKGTRPEQSSELNPSDTEKIQDFKKATAMVASKLANNKDLDIINEQMAEEARQYKANSQNISEGIARQKDFLDNVNKKREMLKSELAQKEMSECSFKPKTNSKAAPRKLKEFLDDQNHFQEKIKSKVEQLAIEERNKKESEFKPNPSITNVDRQPSSEPAFERLFNLSKSNKIEETHEEDHKYVPSIEKKSKDIKRQERIDVSLYNDALRRQMKQNEPSEMKPVAKTNFKSKSEEAFANKLIKLLVKCYERVRTNTTSEDNISLNVLNQLLIESGFMRVNILDESGFLNSENEEEKNSIYIKRFNEEKSLLMEMWTYLEADKGLSLENVRIFLCAIQNLMCAVPLEADKRFNEKHELILSKPEAAKIRRVYDPFNLNRLHFVDKPNAPEEIREIRPYPLIDPVSKTIAEAKRIHEPLSKLADDMAEKKKLKGQEMQKKKQEEEEKKLEECTFTPQIVAYIPKKATAAKRKSKNKLISKAEPSKDRCADLYGLSKKQTQRKAKTQEEYEIEKNGKELTFVPNLSQSTQKVEQKQVYARNVEDSINRIAIARKQSDIKKQMLSRGEPTAITATEKPFICFREKQTKHQSTFDGLKKQSPIAAPKEAKPKRKEIAGPSKATAKIEDGLKKTLNDFRRAEKAKIDKNMKKEAPKKLEKVPSKSDKGESKEMEYPLSSSEEQSRDPVTDKDFLNVVPPMGAIPIDNQIKNELPQSTNAYKLPQQQPTKSDNILLHDFEPISLEFNNQPNSKAMPDSNFNDLDVIRDREKIEESYNKIKADIEKKQNTALAAQSNTNKHEPISHQEITQHLQEKETREVGKQEVPTKEETKNKQSLKDNEPAKYYNIDGQEPLENQNDQEVKDMGEQKEDSDIHDNQEPLENPDMQDNQEMQDNPDENMELQNSNDEKQNNVDIIREESEEGSPPKQRQPEDENEEDHDAENNSHERVPLLYIDVNIGPNESERLEVYEGDTAEELSRIFAEKHSNIVNRPQQRNGKQTSGYAKPANQ